MFSIEAESLDIEALKAQAEDPTCGALVTFEGWVRNHNEGQAVTALEYEAYSALALAEGERIVAEAKKRFHLQQAACVHRVGRLEIGELAVWVGVATPHREAAFQACRYMIDEIKVRVPIWKKEFYESGDSGWVNCEQCAQQGAPQMDFSRQMVLPQMGAMGQRKLAAARVLVVGAGGLGSVVLPYLAAAGVGTLGIVEFDKLDASNLHRQFIYSPDQLGQPKGNLAGEAIRRLNPSTEVLVHMGRFQALEAAELESYDLIVECTDCMETKLAVNRAAIGAGKPVVFASIYQFEGQVQVFDGTEHSSCLQCLWENGAAPAAPTCAVAGVLGPVAGVLGSIQALEAIKFLVGMEGALHNELLMVSLLDYGMRRLALPRNELCKAHQVELNVPKSVEVTFEELASLGAYGMVDIREDYEVQAAPLPVEHRHIPMNQLLEHPALLDPQKTAVLVCAAGMRTKFVATELRMLGYDKVYSLIGGNSVVKV